MVRHRAKHGTQFRSLPTTGCYCLFLSSPTYAEFFTGSEAYHPAGERPDRDHTGAFGVDSGPSLPTGASVPRALGAALPVLTRVQLRDPECEPLPPVVGPSSREM